MSSLRTAAALAVLLAASAASAQVVKCRGADGRVTYSDGPCAAGAPGQAVNVQGNVLDGAADRKDAARYHALAQEEQRSREIAAMMRNPPKHCKNKYFSLNDFTGWEKLEEKARRECVENVLNERDGRPISDVHQRAFKDHQRWMVNEMSRTAEQKEAARRWRQQHAN